MWIQSQLLRLPLRWLRCSPGTTPRYPRDVVVEIIVVIFAASGKTALSFAQQLSRWPDKDSMRVIGVASAGSREYAQGTGFYGEIILYDDYQTARGIIERAVAADRCEKVVMCDSGARVNVAKEWLTLLQASPFCAGKAVMWLGVAGGTTLLSHEEIAKATKGNQALGRTQVNAFGMRDAAMSRFGEKWYFEDFLAAWDDLKCRDGVPGLGFRYEKRMEEVGCAWKRIYDGEIRLDESLLF